jgi:hypothetical protein
MRHADRAMILSALAFAPAAIGQAIDFNALRDDATERTMRLADAGGGWEKGKFYLTDGGANSLQVFGFTQFRANLNWRDEDSAGSQADFTQGFQMRRARLGVRGTIWSTDLSYYVLSEFSRSTGDLGLLDGYGEYKLSDTTSVRWGQFKLPFLREELVTDTQQLTAERSTMNNVFSVTRTQGAMVTYQTEDLRISGAVSDGANALNKDFNASSQADIAVTARGEFRWGEGDFKRFDDMTSWRDSGNAGMVGLALHAQTGGETGSTADTDVFALSADVSLEGNGWNVLVQGVWRRTDPAGGSETDDFGLLVQGGVFVTDQAELFARYDGVYADDANGDDFHVLTVGVNYYVSPRSHAFKLTADVQYYFDAEGDSALVSPTTSTNLLADTETGQVAARVQGQIVF